MASQSRSLNMNSINRGRLKQRFDLIRKLGQGTYGKVQLGINKVTGEEVALKTIKKSKIENDVDLLRIKREINIMSCCNHPNIIHIYEVFENREKIILVMEYAPGGELYDYLNERKKLNETEAKRLFSQIASAIYYCHKHFIVHRDLKLENILLDVNSNAKIADFGLSNVYGEDPLTTFCGSPLYASPEIVKGIPYHGPEVDCWSLGVLLYTLIYGSMPFDGSNFKKLVKQITTSTYYEPPQRSTASELIKALLTVDVRKRLNIIQIVAHSWLQSTDCATVSEEYCHLAPAKGEFLIGINNKSEDTLDEVSEISLLDGVMDEDKSDAVLPTQLTQEANIESSPINAGKSVSPGSVPRKLTVQIKPGAEMQKPAMVCNGDASVGGQETNVANGMPTTEGKVPRKTGAGFKLVKTSSQPRDISSVKPKRAKPVKKALTSALPELSGGNQTPALNPTQLQVPDTTRKETVVEVPSPADGVPLATVPLSVVVTPVSITPAVPKKPLRNFLKKESKSEKSISDGDAGKDSRLTAICRIAASSSQHSNSKSQSLEVPTCLPAVVTQKLVSLENKTLATPPPPVDKKEEATMPREILNSQVKPNPPDILQQYPQTTSIVTAQPLEDEAILNAQKEDLKTDSTNMVPVAKARNKNELATPSTKLEAENPKVATLKIEIPLPDSAANQNLSLEINDVTSVEKIQEKAIAENEAKPKVKLRKKKVVGNAESSQQQQPTRIARRNSKVISQKTAELIQNLKETNKGTHSNSKKIIILPSLNDVKKKFEDKKKEEEVLPQVTRRSSVTIKVEGESGNPTTTVRRTKVAQGPANSMGTSSDTEGLNINISPEEVSVTSNISEKLTLLIADGVGEKEDSENAQPPASIVRRKDANTEIHGDGNEPQPTQTSIGKNECSKIKTAGDTPETFKKASNKQGLEKTSESSRFLPESSKKLVTKTSTMEITSIRPLSPALDSKLPSLAAGSPQPLPPPQNMTNPEIPAEAPATPSTQNIKKAFSNQDVPLVKQSPFQRIAKALSTKQVPPHANPTEAQFVTRGDTQHFVTQVNPPGRPSGLKLFIPPFSSGSGTSEGSGPKKESLPPITPKQKAVETIGSLITKIKSNDSRERLIPIEKNDDDEALVLGSNPVSCTTPSSAYSRQSSVGDPTYNGPIQKSRREFIIPITFEPAKEAESILPSHSGGVYNSHRQPSLSLLTPDTADTTEDEFFDSGTSELLSPDYLFTSLLQRVRGLSQRIHDSEKQQYELSSPSTSRRTPSPSPGYNGSSRDPDPITVTISSAGSSPKVKRHISLDDTGGHSKSPTSTLHRRHSAYLTSPRGQYTPSYLTLPRAKYSTVSEESSTEESLQTDSNALLPSESVLLQKAVHKSPKSSTTSQPSTISKFFNTHLGKLYSKRTQSDSVLNAAEQQPSLTEPPQPRDPSPSSVSDRILRKSYYNRYNYNHLPNYKSTKELSANITKKLEQLLNDI